MSNGFIKAYTPKYNLIIPDFNIATWHDYMETNFRTIDALLNNLFEIQGFVGPWQPNTQYFEGDVVFVGEDLDVEGNETEFSGKLMKVIESHQSGNVEYFNQYYSGNEDKYEFYLDANAAAIYAEKAKEAFNNALASSQNSKNSADLAKQWATKLDDLVNNEDYSSKYYARVSEQYSDLTTKARMLAQQAQIDAEASKTAALVSANNAKESENSAKEYSISASNSSTSAAASMNAAATSALAAKSSAELASKSEKNAATSASTATNKANEASTSAQNSLTYSNNSASSAAESANSAKSAQSYATNASNSAQNASSSVTLAENQVQLAKNEVTKASTYATSAKSSADRAEQIAESFESFNVVVVNVLPTENIQERTIYFVPASEEKENNIYNEFIYINNKWEQIGSTAVDLSNYYTKAETDTKIENIDALPDQANHAGEYLVTDGTTASWSNNLVTLDTEQTITGGKNFVNYTGIRATNPDNENIYTELSSDAEIRFSFDLPEDTTYTASFGLYPMYGKSELCATSDSFCFDGDIPADSNSSQIATTEWTNRKLDNYVTTNTDQTISATKTFDEEIVRKRAFTSSPAISVKIEDTNNKGYTTREAYYTSDGLLYNRLRTYNNTANKDAYLDVIVKDTGYPIARLSFTPQDAVSATNVPNIATMGWVNDPTKALNVVHRTGDETISGAKTTSISKIPLTLTRPSDIGFVDIRTQRKDGTRTGGFRNLSTDGIDNRILMYIAKGDVNVGGLGIMYENESQTAYTFAPTPNVSDNSTKIATTAYVNNKFQVVSALPANPDSNTFYFIPE